jgi:hypothetical protein
MRHLARPSTATREKHADAPARANRVGRRLDRGRLAGAAFVFAAVTALAAVATASSDERDRPPTPHVTGVTPAVKQHADRRRARRSSSEARQRRDESRSAHRDVSSAEALDLARRRFPQILGHKRWRGLDLRPGDRVAEYKDAQTALIDHGGGERSLALAFFPLQAESADGTTAPIDTTLTGTPDGFAPRHGVTDVLLHSDVSRGVSLPRSGVRVYPEAAAAADAEVIDDKLFAANVYTETDFVEAALPNGVETFHQLRSADSPETFTLRFELPAGAHLERLVDPAAIDATGVRIVRGEDELASVSAPAAEDADGEPVPVRFAVEGDRLTIRVDHRGGDFLYPIVLDPTIIENYLYWRDNSGIDFWGWYTGGNTPGQWGYNAGTRSPWGRGLHLYTASSTYSYPVDSYASWNWQAPRASYIYRADFGAVNHTWNWDCIDQGIYSVQNWNWESPPPDKYSAVWPDVYTPPSPYTNGGSNPYRWGLRIVCANGAEASGSITTSNYYAMCPTGTCDPNFGTPGNIMAFGQRIEYGQAPRTNPMPASVMGGAAIYLNDRDNPVVESTGHNTDSRWYRSGTLTVAPRARDDGLGMNKFQLTIPNFVDDYRRHPCTAARCPQTWSLPNDGQSIFSYNIPDIPNGINTVTLRARDVLDKITPASWNLNVDDEQPWLNVYGELREAVYAGTWAGAKTLWINATDGIYPYDNNPRNARAGITAVDIYVDGVKKHTQTQSCYANCRMDFNWTMWADQYRTGSHTIRVVARDGAGNERSSSTWTVSTTAGGIQEEPKLDAADNGSVDGTDVPEEGMPVVCKTDPEVPNPPYCGEGEDSNPAQAEASQELSLSRTPFDSGLARIQTCFPGVDCNWGFSDQGGLYDLNQPWKNHIKDPRFQRLGVKKLRVMIPWDILLREKPHRYTWYLPDGRQEYADLPADPYPREYWDAYMRQIKEEMNAGRIDQVLVSIRSTEEGITYGTDTKYKLGARVLPAVGNKDEALESCNEMTYICNVRRIIMRYRGPGFEVPIKFLTAFNEPNHKSYAPSGVLSYPSPNWTRAQQIKKGATRAAQYFNVLRKWCNKPPPNTAEGNCAVAAGDMIDNDDLVRPKTRDLSYLHVYRDALEFPPKQWAYHAYSAARYMRNDRLNRFRDTIRPQGGSRPPLWLTEQGPQYNGTTGNHDRCVDSEGKPITEKLELRKCQWRVGGEQLTYLLRIPNEFAKETTRFYFYSWKGNYDGKIRDSKEHDSGMIDRHVEAETPPTDANPYPAEHLRHTYCVYGERTSPPFTQNTFRTCPYVP